METKMKAMVALSAGLVLVTALAFAQGPPEGAPAGGPPGVPGGPFAGPPGAPPGQFPGPEGMPPGMDREEVMKMVENLRIARLSKALELTDEETVMLMRRYEEAKAEAGELKKQRHETLKALRDAVETGKPDETIQAELDKLLALDQKLTDFKRQTYEKVSAQLTLKQKAKLYVFMQDFDEDMREMINRARRMREGGWEGEKGPGAGEWRERAQKWREGEGPHGEGPHGEGPAPGQPRGFGQGFGPPQNAPQPPAGHPGVSGPPPGAPRQGPPGAQGGPPPQSR